MMLLVLQTMIQVARSYTNSLSFSFPSSYKHALNLMLKEKYLPSNTCLNISYSLQSNISQGVICTFLHFFTFIYSHPPSIHSSTHSNMTSVILMQMKLLLSSPIRMTMFPIQCTYKYLSPFIKISASFLKFFFT